MGSQIEVSELKPCPASSDRAYIATNTALWLLGAFGMFWMTSNLALNLVMPVAYLVVNFVFFWRIFPRVVCASCAYHHPALSRDEYLVDFRDRFVAALKRWYKVWVLIGWAWPIAAMTTTYLVSGKPVVLVSLLVFLFISFGVFLPVLRLRVCPRCKANELGICPFFPSEPVGE
jgi:hypothetical protein